MTRQGHARRIAFGIGEIMNRIWVCGISLLFFGFVAFAQSTPQQVTPLLAQKLGDSNVVSDHLQNYLMGLAKPLPQPAGAKEWTEQANRLRSRLLKDVVYHGWPPEWVDSPARFEDLGVIPSGKGYIMHKLRYEVVPGFWSTAILYEPENMHGVVPAMLNVNGHVGWEGKSVEYKQKRCINFALQGMIALSLEWIGQGELQDKEDQHFYNGALDLVGVNSVGLYYLEMRRGLDYLYGLPNVDRSRLGVTGLSGGGWQTMLLASLDGRIKVSIPVAGYDALAEWIPRMPAAAGDNEQAATDMLRDQDYATLTAMRAPLPTLLINNAEDDCCFRAAIVKPYLYDAIKPFYRLYNQPDHLEFHENTDPSTHNYQLDNRMAAYRFLDRFFDLPVTEHEARVSDQIKSFEDLKVGLPSGQLTLLSLAVKLASEIKRAPIPSEGGEKERWAAAKRSKLSEDIRYKDVLVNHAWAMTATKDKGIESLGYKFRLSNGLPATGVWLKGIEDPSDSPISIVLNDKGKAAAADVVSDRINRGDQVLALDLIFTGDSATPQLPNPWAYPEMIASQGQRPLGVEVAQLLALTRWMKEHAGTNRVRLEVTGMRMQLVALAASAIAPDLYSQVIVHEGIQSLGYLLTAPVHYESFADMFCLDLYKDFDLNEITALGGKTAASNESPIETAKQ